jgi:hypothetical protein
MAPIKFEENIKEKLEKRTLQPSELAWNKLSEKLEADSKKSSNKTIWWLGIAASLVGILVMVNVFFKTSETNNQSPILVDTEVKEAENLQNKENVEPQEIIVAIEELNVETETILEDKIKTNKRSQISKYHTVKNTSIAEIKSLQEPEEIITNSKLKTSSNKTEIAQVEVKEETNPTETDIDALLRNAQQNLAKNTADKSYAIDAKALLQDVEEDLDESFRNKVFETLKTSYKKVKTAVAERND